MEEDLGRAIEKSRIGVFESRTGSSADPERPRTLWIAIDPGTRCLRVLSTWTAVEAAFEAHGVSSPSSRRLLSRTIETIARRDRPRGPRVVVLDGGPRDPDAETLVGTRARMDRTLRYELDFVPCALGNAEQEASDDRVSVRDRSVLRVVRRGAMHEVDASRTPEQAVVGIELSFTRGPAEGHLRDRPSRTQPTPRRIVERERSTRQDKEEVR